MRLWFPNWTRFSYLTLRLECPCSAPQRGGKSPQTDWKSAKHALRRQKAAPNEGGPKMAVAANTVATMSDDEHRRQLRRALIASTVGTTIEWYDFLLYGTVSALVFGPIFFPQSDPLMGVLQSFGIFFIGFVGRPIGAAIFGHWGDRIGRKATLIATLLLTGIATTLVGLVPTYDSIGMWGAVLLNPVYFGNRSFSSLWSRWCLTQRRSAIRHVSWLIRAWNAATRRVRSSAVGWQWW